MGRDPDILVTGGDGQVGRALRRHLPEARFTSRGELDVTEPRQVQACMPLRGKVIHLAAFTNVARAESEPSRAYLTNSQGTLNVVEAALKKESRVFYVSTDYVFDGAKPGEYTESDEPCPINHYGRSKLEGEGYVLGNAAGLVIRSSWIYGEGTNFVRTVLRVARSGQPVQVVEDQIGRPTYADDLAAAIAFLVATDQLGVVNVTGDGMPCSWAQIAAASLDFAGVEAEVVPISSARYRSEMETVAVSRPSNSVLSLGVARALGVPLRDWRRSLADYVKLAA